MEIIEKIAALESGWYTKTHWTFQNSFKLDDELKDDELKAA